jgi:hypothetical protein
MIGCGFYGVFGFRVVKPVKFVWKGRSFITVPELLYSDSVEERLLTLQRDNRSHHGVEQAFSPCCSAITASDHGVEQGFSPALQAYRPPALASEVLSRV